MFFVLFSSVWINYATLWREKKTCGKNYIELQNLFYVNWIRTFKVRSSKCVPINEIEFGISDEIERLSSWHEIEWQLRVVKLNEYLSKLNEIKSKRNDIKTKLNAQRMKMNHESRELTKIARTWMQFEWIRMQLWWNWAGKPNVLNDGSRAYCIKL